MSISSVLDCLKRKYKLKTIQELCSVWLKNTPEQKQLIEKFSILCHEERYLINDVEMIQNYLDSLKNVETLKSVIKESNLSDANFYISILDSYKKQIDKIDVKSLITKYDEDEYAENFVSAVVKPLRDSLFSNLAVSLYRSLKFASNEGNDSDVNKVITVVKAFNKYLEDCNIYTRTPKVGSKPQHDDLDQMDAVQCETDKKSNKGIIFEVERLPYFLRYVDGDCEITPKCIKGKFFVYKN